MSLTNTNEYYVTNRGYKIAKRICRDIKDEFSRKRAFAALICMDTLADYLYSQGYNIDISKNLYKILPINEEFEFTDIHCNGYFIDVIPVVNERFMLIPKNHFENGIAPDLYVAATYSPVNKKVKFAGCISSQDIDKSKQNEYYYIVRTDLLSAPDLVEETVSIPKTNTITDENHENFAELFISYLDGTIDFNDKKHLLKHLIECKKCRDKFVDFFDYEMIAIHTQKHPDVLADHTLGIVGGAEVDDERYKDFKEVTLEIDKEPDEYAEDEESTAHHKTIKSAIEDPLQILYGNKNKEMFDMIAEKPVKKVAKSILSDIINDVNAEKSSKETKQQDISAKTGSINPQYYAEGLSEGVIEEKESEQEFIDFIDTENQTDNTISSNKISQDSQDNDDLLLIENNEEDNSLTFEETDSNVDKPIFIEEQNYEQENQSDILQEQTSEYEDKPLFAEDEEINSDEKTENVLDFQQEENINQDTINDNLLIFNDSESQEDIQTSKNTDFIQNEEIENPVITDDGKNITDTEENEIDDLVQFDVEDVDITDENDNEYESADGTRSKVPSNLEEAGVVGSSLLDYEDNSNPISAKNQINILENNEDDNEDMLIIDDEDNSTDSLQKDNKDDDMLIINDEDDKTDSLQKDNKDDDMLIIDDEDDTTDSLQKDNNTTEEKQESAEDNLELSSDDNSMFLEEEELPDLDFENLEDIEENNFNEIKPEKTENLETEKNQDDDLVMIDDDDNKNNDFDFVRPASFSDVKKQTEEDDDLVMIDDDDNKNNDFDFVRPASFSDAKKQTEDDNDFVRPASMNWDFPQDDSKDISQNEDDNLLEDDFDPKDFEFPDEQEEKEEEEKKAPSQLDIVLAGINKEKEKNGENTEITNNEIQISEYNPNKNIFRQFKDAITAKEEAIEAGKFDDIEEPEEIIEPLINTTQTDDEEDDDLNFIDDEDVDNLKNQFYSKDFSDVETFDQEDAEKTEKIENSSEDNPTEEYEKETEDFDEIEESEEENPDSDDIEEYEEETEEENPDSDDIEEYEEEIYDEDEENTEEENPEDETEEVETSSEEDKKKKQKTIAIIIAASVIGLAVLAGGGFAAKKFIFDKNQNAQTTETNDILGGDTQTSENPEEAGALMLPGDDNKPQPTTEEDGLMIPDGNNENELGASMPAPQAEAPEQASQQPEQPAQQNVSQENQSEENQLTQGISSSDITVNKLSWGVGAALAGNTEFKSYLQRTGKIIKGNLNKDLKALKVNKPQGVTKLLFVLSETGTIESTATIKSCGSKQVDDFVLQSITQSIQTSSFPLLSEDTLKANEQAVKSRNIKLSLTVAY